MSTIQTTVVRIIVKRLFVIFQPINDSVDFKDLGGCKANYNGHDPTLHPYNVFLKFIQNLLSYGVYRLTK